MCCIFTCCGWMVDLIQRLWTFTMSCFISSAVCCSLVTASMSGVALGYNYSLAEYIDLKETNVSVYLKRGVFDDEIGDDMAWRRSGHQPIAGQIKDSNLITGDTDESKPLRSGRRLDDSIYESNDRSNFEGSLMRLTAKPIDSGTTLPPIETPLDKVLSRYTMGSLDQLKAVQGLINKKKMEAESGRRNFNQKANDDFVVPETGRNYANMQSGRRAYLLTMPSIEPRSTYSSFRAAVPADNIGDPLNWLLPKVPPDAVPADMQYIDSYRPITYPSPVTPRPGPARPTRPSALARPRSKPTPTHTTLSPTKQSKGPEMNLPKSIDEDIEAFKKKLMEDRFDRPLLKDEDFLKKMDVGKIKPNDDYDEDIKGVPLRKKRNTDDITSKNNYANETKLDGTKDVVNSNTKLDANFGKMDREIVDNQNKSDIIGQDVNKATELNLEESPMKYIIKFILSAMS